MLIVFLIWYLLIDSLIIYSFNWLHIYYLVDSVFSL